MGIKIIDTFNEIDKYRKANSCFKLETWKEYCDQISPSLFELCVNDASCYDLGKDVFPVIEDTIFNHFDLVEKAEESMKIIASQLPSQLLKTFDIVFGVSLIFYLGLCNGAGWATTLNGESTILLGVEKIVELGWYDLDSMSDLVCHELSHLIHFRLRENNEIIGESIWELYSEGFATRYSKRLYKEGFFHQNHDGWLDFCLTNLTKIKKEYLFRLQNNSDTRDFFGDWNSFMGRSNLGYFLGCEFTYYLEKTFTPIEIARLTGEEITLYLYSFLAE